MDNNSSRQHDQCSLCSSFDHQKQTAMGLNLTSLRKLLQRQSPEVNWKNRERTVIDKTVFSPERFETITVQKYVFFISFILDFFFLMQRLFCIMFSGFNSHNVIYSIWD